MKKLLSNIIKLAMIAAAPILIQSCDVHEFPGDDLPTPAVPTAHCRLHLRYDTDEMPLLTTVEYGSSRSVEQHFLRAIITIYDINTNKIVELNSTQKNITIRIPADASLSDVVIPLNLPQGHYRILVWSDYVDTDELADKFFNTTNLSYISSNQINGLHPGNLDERIAFRGETELIVTKTETQIDCTAEMIRPMARFRFIATDINELNHRSTSLSDYTATIVYPNYMPSAFNLLTDRPVDSNTGQYFHAKPQQLNASEAQLGFDHVLVSKSKSSVQVALAINLGSTTTATTGTLTIPLERGRLTEIRGRFFSSTATGGVGISPGFNGDYNIEIK